MAFNEVQLKDICSIIKRGISPKYADFGVPVINQRCIRENRINWNIARFHNLEKKNIPTDRYLKRFDVCVNSTGVGTLGRLAQLKENVSKSTVDSHVTIIRCNSNDVDKLYFGWAVKYLEPTITDMGEGSTGQTELSRHRVGDLKIPLPPLAEQKRIAHLLGSLDDKIELNRKMNETLEEMAQAIFKSWFIDFDGVPTEDLVDSELGLIPKGWEVKTLKDAITINPKLSIKKGTEATYIEMKALPTNAMSVSSMATREYKGGMRFQNNDTLLARITPCLENGKTAFVQCLKDSEIAFGSTEFIVLRTKEHIPKVWSYCLARNDVFRAHAITNMTGSSGRQRVPYDAVADFKIALPTNNELFKKFGDCIHPLFAKVSFNAQQSQTLSELRDTLLPKLISGEIRIPEAEEQVEQQLSLLSEESAT